ncbi:hypothetical protein METBIDRAFT_34478 [Metschnikowia bicuspidata var. bicuspidata NRRL YB-4993]|uniref:Transcription activator of gluconeogenesis ERT1 n=1 Tax=Metschnikowia bicuspidata var. bicuspidata NRRL YB-4993 TaxID=869754 RepID=A0A1A0HH50_9ASCO|nr:hypothetical protein METBIDRAFT_34478 [Metschnikowia bicuspidata var. bicuspidata NRRL YB-4993]OBA23326.1 hypothetical protein METBIDRAFT_34478 [Metschnikowia bicuspidata var. bicuspidata NRRL YB-4993]
MIPIPQVLTIQKRKKIFWACNHCNKAHITCEAARPCLRCIKKGLQDTCEDAPRKRKKYLADIPSPVVLKGHEKPHAEGSTAAVSKTVCGVDMMPSIKAEAGLNPETAPHMFKATQFQQSASLPDYLAQRQTHLARSSSGNEPGRGAPLHPNYMAQSGTLGAAPEKKRTFLSSAADMEYTTLSSILQDNFMGVSQTHSLASTEGTPASVNLSPNLSPHGYNEMQKVPHSQALAAPYNATDFSPNSSQLEDPKYNGSGMKTNQYPSLSEFPPFDARINQYFLGNTSQHTNVTYPEVREAMENLKQNSPAQYFSRSSKLSLSFTMGFPPIIETSRNLLFNDPEEIYVKIKKPFSYTPGFHKLIAYLRSRFPREMLVKMAESMAVYRPSFIACTNSLRESDLIFMEQCFQRTLLTYDNFIKVSGTPTIVWRRTGEIAYVGHEFTTLTGWTQDHLLGGKPTFIVELLDDESVVEYFQLFSKIAFGDFLGATMTECTLLTPKQNVKIRAGCSWTMKRDVFGIPMMIVGNFLPIL